MGRKRLKETERKEKVTFRVKKKYIDISLDIKPDLKTSQFSEIAFIEKVNKEIKNKDL